MKRSLILHTASMLLLTYSGMLTAQTTIRFTEHKFCLMLESGQCRHCTDYLPGFAILESCRINPGLYIEFKWPKDDSMYRIYWDRFDVKMSSENKYIYSVNTPYTYDGKTSDFKLKLTLIQTGSNFGIENILCATKNDAGQLVATFLKP